MNALAPYSYPSQLHSNLFGTGQGNNFNPGQGNGNGPMSPRSTAAAASAFNLDPSILQTTIGSLLQSPAAAQLFLNSLNNSVQGQSLNTPHPVPTNQPSFPFPSSETQQQQPNPQQFLNGSQNQNQTQDALDPTLALFTPLPNHDGLMNHSDNLLKSYQGAAGMNQDVDKLQESIDSLVRSMGLDPNSNANTNTNANPNMGMGMGMAMGQTQPPQQQQQQMAGDNTNGFNSGSGNEFDMNMDMGMDMGMGGETFDNNFDVDQFLTELAKSEKQIQEESKAGQGQGQGQ
jgi:heat shock transcription factor